MKRVCKLYVSPIKRKALSPPASDNIASKRHDNKNKGKGKVPPNISMEKVASYKLHGAHNCKHLSFAEKEEALKLLKTMTGTAVALKIGIGHSTLYKLKKEARTIMDKAQTLKPDAKSTRGAKHTEPSQAVINAARAWIGVKDNDEVANMTLEDMKDQLLKKFLYQSENESSGDEDEDGFMGEGSASGAVRKGAGSSVFSIPPPPYSQVAGEFASLETTVEECSMNYVSYHRSLRKAKLAWISNRGKDDQTSGHSRFFWQSRSFYSK
ncbi:unnamed protein product [Choristocarpus tenellus]